MVYERKCAQCGDLIDFGGEPDELPDDAIEFNGDFYCRECVRDFVEFGTGEVVDKVEKIEKNLRETREELGMAEME